MSDALISNLLAQSLLRASLTIRMLLRGFDIALTHGFYTLLPIRGHCPSPAHPTQLAKA